MLIVISPAKTLNTDKVGETAFTQPQFLEESQILNKKLKSLSKKKLSELMNISKDLAQLNHERNESWQLPFTLDNAKPAIQTFQGDVYQGLNAADFSDEDLAFSQDILRMLSGLYGVLRPLDLMQPYRLEMGISLPVRRQKNLYQFWGNKITELLDQTITNQTDSEQVLLNLASNEYFKAVVPKQMSVPVITIAFKEQRGEQYKMIGVFAKKARGLMTRYIIKNRITTSEAVKSFDVAGYSFAEDFSTDSEWVFTRPEV